MRYLINILQLVVLFLILPMCLSAQVITGKVYRAGTDSVIAQASVYYGGSQTGTSSNTQGVFELQQLPGKIPIVVSSVGYYSTIVNSYTAGQALTIYLKPKVNELGAVTIRSSDMSRADMEKAFFREFIGVSDNAASCKILNFDDIDLSYNKTTETLKAFCDKPIEIDNKRLGYHISYYLDKFVRTSRNVLYDGNYIFKDLDSSGVDKKIAKYRETAYSGSRMEFIRALWANKLSAHGFRLYTNYRMTPYPIDSMLAVNKSGEKFINLKQKVLIVHDQDTRLITSLGQSIANCYINQQGFYDTGLKWYGHMGVQRVGDLLPFEYRSVKDVDGNSVKQTPIVSEESMQDTSTYRSKKFPREIRVFKAIVLTPNNLLDKRLVVKKWQIPILYKVYGDFGPAINHRIDSVFNQVSRLTGLKINRTTVDSLVNFSIVAGNLDSYKNILTPDVLAYFKANDGEGGAYYTFNENGFSSMIQLVKPVPHTTVWSVVEKQMMNGLGFFGVADGYFKSIFYEYAVVTPLQLTNFDMSVIKTFYNPDIKSGMTEQQLDVVLVGIKWE